MIVSPQNPYNLYLPNIPILSKLVKNEFCGHFQNSLQVRKNFKNYYGSIDFLEMPTPMGKSLCHLVRIDVKQEVGFKWVFYKWYL